MNHAERVILEKSGTQWGLPNRQKHPFYNSFPQIPVEAYTGCSQRNGYKNIYCDSDNLRKYICLRLYNR